MLFAAPIPIRMQTTEETLCSDLSGKDIYKTGGINHEKDNAPGNAESK